MNCPNCNAEMDKKDVVCKNCGFRQVTPKNENAKEEKNIVIDKDCKEEKNQSLDKREITHKNVSIIVILVVAAISIVTIISCYLTYSSRYYRTQKCTVTEDVFVNTITFDDIVIEIPQGWNYVNYDETLLNTILYKDGWNSYATVLTDEDITFQNVENNGDKLLSSLEEEGFSSLSVEKATVNNVKYIIVTGKKDKHNYFIIYINGNIMYGAEGIYDNYDDLNTMVNFLTYIHKVMNHHSHSLDNHYFNLIK